MVVVPYDPVQINSATASIKRSRASLTRPINQYRHRRGGFKRSLPNGQLLFLELSVHRFTVRGDLTSPLTNSQPFPIPAFRSLSQAGTECPMGRVVNNGC